MKLGDQVGLINGQEQQMMQSLATEWTLSFKRKLLNRFEGRTNMCICYNHLPMVAMMRIDAGAIKLSSIM